MAPVVSTYERVEGNDSYSQKTSVAMQVRLDCYNPTPPLPLRRKSGREADKKHNKMSCRPVRVAQPNQDLRETAIKGLQ